MKFLSPASDGVISNILMIYNTFFSNKLRCKDTFFSNNLQDFNFDNVKIKFRVKFGKL